MYSESNPQCHYVGPQSKPPAFPHILEKIFCQVFCWPFQRSYLGSRTHVGNVTKPKQSAHPPLQTSSTSFVQRFPEEPDLLKNMRDPEGPRTARNVLKLALTTLSSVSSSIPIAAPLGGIIDALLAVAERIEQTSANKKGLAELAARIQALAPILSDTARIRPGDGQIVVESLRGELQSIKMALDAATSRGEIDQFFNSPENASSLANYNSNLDRIIAEFTLVTVNQVLKSIHALQSKLLESPSSVGNEGIIEMGNITGGIGGTGGHARIGGYGGEGEGPQLEMDPAARCKIGNVSGGTGGTGGTGIEIGGKGGTGKAPVISFLRR
ncbi:hypothetical protein C8J57DRAFT_1329090 [Mycena rebaudengoi]|nr:hypothetical protein C8J57DRAFT_1329090 [Mycena rebaudengoi]